MGRAAYQQEFFNPALESDAYVNNYNEEVKTKLDKAYKMRNILIGVAAGAVVVAGVAVGYLLYKNFKKSKSFEEAGYYNL